MAAVEPIRLSDLEEEIKRFKRVLDGDDASDVTGVRPRLKAVEATVAQLVTARKEIKILLYGISVGVATANIDNIKGLIGLLSKLFVP
jgi:PP-loop superfamily ATP-utilizing enzyme